MRKASRGRPRSFDENAVLDAAMRAFWEHGYEGTSVATLEAATGLRAPSLYGAFGSKEALYQSALERYASEHGAVLRPDGPAREAISEFLLEAADRFSEGGLPPGCMISTAALGVGAAQRGVATRPARMRAQTLDGIEQRLRRAVDQGELPDTTDVAALARLVGAVIQGMSVQAIDGAARTDLRALATVAMSAWPTEG
ncbi:TetR/AcrR family transcriptional regulator [Nocardioides sp. NPDC059952]|uniref:TetR/AcrR family transcriptional regulator n=1 Tax=Nocardioides sp. NPDC059952 TaxID=3347014 RepID=UPI00364C57AD